MEPQAETRLWQRLINVETAVEKLNKAIGEFQSAHTGLERLGYLEEKTEDSEKRIRTLEESRQRQIVLNMETGNKLKEISDKLKKEKQIFQPETKPKGFWNTYFKK